MSMEIIGIKKPSFLKIYFSCSILKEIYAIRYLVLQKVKWCYVERNILYGKTHLIVETFSKIY